MLYEGLLTLVLIYGSETVVWRMKQRSRIRDAQIDNFKGLEGIRIIYRIANLLVRELCVMKNR